MIGWLSGQIIDKQQPGKLVLNVNGVGYDVETSLATFFQVESLPAPVSLHIHTVVREDALLLYGFFTQQERQLFRALIKVNGIGPKSAIAILSSMNPEEFVQCIQHHNLMALTKLPGIGKKTAERLLIEMKDKIMPMASMSSPVTAHHQHRQELAEAISALEALGYKPNEASKMIQRVDDGEKNCEQLIRLALQNAVSQSG